MTQTAIPRWDMSNIFPAIESPQFETAVRQVSAGLDALEQHFTAKIKPCTVATPLPQLAENIGTLIDMLNQTGSEAGLLRAYLGAFISTDTRNKLAMKKMSEFEQTQLRLHNLYTEFQAWVGTISAHLDAIIPANASTAAHAFALREMALQAGYMMSGPEENLASELSLSGSGAWSKLQGTLTSQLSVDFELDGSVQKLPMPALINLHSHPDADVRRRAYEAEMQAWKTIEEPLAAALNGIKGSVVTLNKRRGRQDAVHAAIDSARIDRPTLEAMLSAMEDSFPAFRRYFKKKAARLGKERLAWWDVFAPMGESKSSYNWDEARGLILSNFEKFSPILSTFAARAFDRNWIDAEQRDGKHGGAFCMGLNAVRESRVMCNFDGSLDQVSTIAHELGHAFHNECAYQAGKTDIQQDTPMTLAETASIMCETIVMEAILAASSDPQEKLAILETRLIGDAQVIVDIYSRYLFESEVFARRAKSELSADEFCEIMEWAQKQSYGDGLDDSALMKYMWTWKPHYYSAGLSFYNFPYAFGLLFATGLYAIYKQRGESFIPDYIGLLSSTGEASAADLASRFGIDIRDKKFWADSLSIITRNIDLYESL